jgi:hypothetical protein
MYEISYCYSTFLFHYYYYYYYYYYSATHFCPLYFSEMPWTNFMKPCRNIICGKVCPTDSDFFGSSRSTSCGCCSYQVSSISDWRVTCYDIFVIFNFLAFWPFPWQCIILFLCFNFLYYVKLSVSPSIYSFRLHLWYLRMLPKDNIILQNMFCFLFVSRHMIFLQGFIKFDQGISEK